MHNTWLVRGFIFSLLYLSYLVLEVEASSCNAMLNLDSVESVAALETAFPGEPAYAQFRHARDCLSPLEAGERARFFTLLIRELEALIEQERLEEGQQVIDVYFEEYRPWAEATHEAHIYYLWFQILQHQADFLGIVANYKLAFELKNTLPLADQTTLELIVADALVRLKRFEEAMGFAEHAMMQLEGRLGHSLLLHYQWAIASRIRGTAEFGMMQSGRAGSPLEIEWALVTATETFRRQRQWSEAALALVALGQLKWHSGDAAQALLDMHQAVQYAGQGPNKNIKVYALVNRGEIRTSLKQWSAALLDYEKALLLTAGRQQHMRDDLQARIRDAKTQLFQQYMIVLLMLIGLGFFGWKIHKGRRSTIEAISPPPPVSPLLLTRRRRRIYRVLTAPETYQHVVDDPQLQQVLHTGKIKRNKELFLIVGALEEANGERQFENDPDNTISRYLRREYKKHGWPWPKSPEAWLQHFQIYPLEDLESASWNEAA